jgi:hypothetical protein
MVDQNELAICKRRGHAGLRHDGWVQCAWCGSWIREIRKIEESDVEPPAEEVNPDVKTVRLLNRVKLETESVSLTPPRSREHPIDTKFIKAAIAINILWHGCVEALPLPPWALEVAGEPTDSEVAEIIERHLDGTN